ncbi:MAG: hypothetical protein DSY80_04480 [Desulfocapsa sp.]|nr:MAG: hypothetical protein DSY80_04480 [Desulfocapsa sp.]
MIFVGYDLAKAYFVVIQKQKKRSKPRVGNSRVLKKYGALGVLMKLKPGGTMQHSGVKDTVQEREMVIISGGAGQSTKVLVDGIELAGVEKIEIDPIVPHEFVRVKLTVHRVKLGFLDNLVSA